MKIFQAQYAIIAVFTLVAACRVEAVQTQVISLTALVSMHSSALAASASAMVQDPNKLASEFNHHMAGWALIGVGFLVLAGFFSPNLHKLRYVWPALFLLAGIFLAVWSDAEIWPRGNLSWGWLLHHDHEAGQHKIYALILVAIGTIEYLRACDCLNRFWRAWAFPALAIFGAVFLLVHDHTASSGATSPEARAYLVNPALDPDGNRPDSRTSNPTFVMTPSAMDMDHSAMDHSHMDMSGESTPVDPPSPGHHHMTASMMLVEREHFWFMIVGIGVALVKLVSDSGFLRRHFMHYAWPSGMVLLGVLLVLYRE